MLAAVFNMVYFCSRSVFFNALGNFEKKSNSGNNLESSPQFGKHQIKDSIYLMLNQKAPISNLSAQK